MGIYYIQEILLLTLICIYVRCVYQHHQMPLSSIISLGYSNPLANFVRLDAGWCQPEDIPCSQIDQGVESRYQRKVTVQQSFVL